MEVVYEDNHIIIVNKTAGEIVQGDKTGDTPLSETLKQWIKEKYAKPGNVFCGVTHRIDRPVCGLVVFARTSKGLSRMNELFRNGNVKKTLEESEAVGDWSDFISHVNERAEKNDVVELNQEKDGKITY